MGDWFEKVTIGTALDRAAGRFGTREALTCAGRRWSFQEFKADCDRAARGLMQCGVQPGEKVSLWLPNRPEWLHAMFAVAKISAALVPINTRFRVTDLEYVLHQSDSTTLITIDCSGPIGYLNMVRELIPELDACPDPQTLRTAALPALRRVLVVSGEPYPGTMRWDDVVASGDAVSTEQ